MILTRIVVLGIVLEYGYYSEPSIKGVYYPQSGYYSSNIGGKREKSRGGYEGESCSLLVEGSRSVLVDALVECSR